MEKTVRSVCHLCGYHFIDIHVQDNKAIKISASSRGNKGDDLCVKAKKGLLPWNYSEKRIAFPMIRNGESWEKVSWDEALDFVCEKLNKIRQIYAPEALSLYFGTGLICSGAVAIHAMGHFAKEWETPNVGSFGENCYLPRVLSSVVTFGSHITPDLDPKASPACIVIWGCNPSASLGPLAPRILNFRKQKGSKLIVIDPMKIPLAKVADIHLQPRPGTDSALALAMINTIIQEGLYDADFVENYTSGFDKLKEHVKGYKPEDVGDIVSIPVPSIKEAARLLAKSKPTAFLRFLGCETHTSSFDALRAVDILTAITGNVDNEGGNVLTPVSLLHVDAYPKSKKALGYEKNFLYCEIIGGCVGNYLADAILEGNPYPVRAMIVDGSDPAMMHANSGRMREALKRLDLLVQMDVVRNETSDFANVLLPAASFLEKNELASSFSAWDNDSLKVIEKAVEPPDASLPDYEIWLKLCKRMGYKVPWENFEDACTSILKPLGITLDQVKNAEAGWYPREFGKYKTSGFRTPSSKIDLYSNLLEERGINPIPIYREPMESPKSQPSLAKEYPLIAIDSREVEYYQTRFHDIPDLLKLRPEPRVDINPDDAERFGIVDGELVIVESPRGKIKIKARVTQDIKEGVINIPIGWAEANVNFLTSDNDRDPVIGSSAMRAYLCRVRKHLT